MRFNRAHRLRDIGHPLGRHHGDSKRSVPSGDRRNRGYPLNHRILRLHPLVIHPLTHLIGLQIQQFHQFSSPTRFYRITDREFLQNILPVSIDCIHTNIKGSCYFFTR